MANQDILSVLSSEIYIWTEGCLYVSQKIQETPPSSLTGQAKKVDFTDSLRAHLTFFRAGHHHLASQVLLVSTDEGILDGQHCGQHCGRTVNILSRQAILHTLGHPNLMQV